MHILSYENEVYLHVNGNSFQYEWLSTKTLFEKEEPRQEDEKETKFMKQTEGFKTLMCFSPKNQSNKF